jgi:polyferredoxin
MTKRQKIRKSLTLISFLLFPATFYYLSPYLIVAGTLEGIITGSFIFFALLLISSLIFGRAFCGWVCPAGGIQDVIIEIKGRRVKRGNIIKWLIWVPWITIIVMFAIRNGGYREVDPFYRTTYGFSIGNVYALITYLLVLTLIVVPSFLIGRRSFCHSICWMAPFMIIGRKLRNLTGYFSLGLSSLPDKCISCSTCTTNCPMSLPVGEMVKRGKMEHPECILCGNCADNCKSKAIKFGFGVIKK